MTDLISTEPGPAAPFGLLNELLSLRAELAAKADEYVRNLAIAIDTRDSEIERLCAELAEAKESLRLSAQGLQTYVEALNAGNAALAEAKALQRATELCKDGAIETANQRINELAEAKARIAELEQQAEFYVKMLTGGGSAAYLGELTEAKARIAELEAYHTNCTDYINGLLGNMADDDKERVAILARAEKAEAELAAKDARITEFEARLQRQYAILLEHKSRAEQAEAELDISREAHRMVQSALLSQAAETERAEAELAAIRPLVAQADGWKAVIVGLKRDAERAEAERDAMREALRKIEQETIDHVAVRIARAALATSLAGREG